MHFDGLTMLLEMRDSSTGGMWHKETLPDDITDRYVFL